MNPKDRPTRYLPAVATAEGAGVIVHRTIGTPALRNHDPFMLLDYFSSSNPGEYIAGFPPHPHRGFVTFTYMLNGYIEHRDSMGNTGNLGPGGAQWMKAGSGVIHSEMPKQDNGLMRGFQLWVNLPAANKMDTPEYQEYTADDFPLMDMPDYRVKILVGRFANINAPIMDDLTGVSYLDVQVQPGKRFQHVLENDRAGFLYLYAGDGHYDGERVPINTLVVPGTNTGTVNFVAGKQGAQFIFVSGRPITEPVVQYGPFVMNTREEIEQAMQDFESNSFVRDRAWINRK